MLLVKNIGSTVCTSEINFLLRFWYDLQKKKCRSVSGSDKQSWQIHSSGFNGLGPYCPVSILIGSMPHLNCAIRERCSV